MLEHLLQWIEYFDPLDELGSIIADCSEPSVTADRSVGPDRSSWLITQFRALIGLDTWTFYVAEGNGWCGAKIERMLADHGIRIRSRGFAFGDIFFNIKLNQAEWAEHLLLRAGVPVKYGLYSAMNERYRHPTESK